MTLTQKLPFYMRIFWGLIVAFILVGILAGKAEKAVMLAIIVTIINTLSRIMNEAFMAWQGLRILAKAHESNDHDGDQT